MSEQPTFTLMKFPKERRPPAQTPDQQAIHALVERLQQLAKSDRWMFEQALRDFDLLLRHVFTA